MRRLLTIFLCLLWPCIAAGETFSGAGRVIDGDTLQVGGHTVRLHGIDAPEHDQPCLDAGNRRYACGSQASRALDGLAKGELSCTALGRDRYDRVIAVCRAAGGELNRAMVAAGWALAFRRYSEAYVADEAAARAARRGLWAGEFDAPWEWRAAGKMANRRQASARGRKDCRIKGNVSDSGRIYHVPGSHAYARTRIDRRRGERWFCTEAEAQAAGWRAPRN